MTTAQIYLEALRRGLTIEPFGASQISVGPRCILERDPEFRELIRENKMELLDLLHRSSVLHVARQVLADEFTGADEATREYLALQLMSLAHPLCDAALERLSFNDGQQQEKP